MPDAFTPASAERMQELFDIHEAGFRDLTPAEHAELSRLADAWQHAVYLDSLTLVSPDWQPPQLTEAMVRQALRDAGQPGDDEQVAMVMRGAARENGI